MATDPSRRRLIRAIAGGSALLVSGRRALAHFGPDSRQGPASPAPPPGQSGGGPTAAERPPALDADQVREFVQLAHHDFEGTWRRLDANPRVLRATWDWGDGDFETALGGAAHMGRRDIAELLVDRGAPLDLFAAAMLGHLPLVQAALDWRPALLHVPGPHGIPLVAHAKAGGPSAAPVLEYLTRLGAA